LTPIGDRPLVERLEATEHLGHVCVLGNRFRHRESPNPATAVVMTTARS
jgi:hypothetical protein